MPIIELNGVTKYYGKSKGIENLNLSVEKGDIFGFIGPNGAGKSTTIRILMNFIFPSSGEVNMFGKDVTKYPEKLKKDIGYMPSDVSFYKTLKVKDLLNYSCKLHNVKDKNRIKEIANIFDLDLNKKFEDLSFGNKKKVSIVQALLHKPQLLILDEPTGGLDPLVQKTFFEYLKMENHKGTTIFFSSHTLSEVQKMCKNVGIIKKGKMIQVENIQSIRSKQLKKVYIESFDDLNIDIFSDSCFKKVVVKDNISEFYYKGDINKLIKILSQINLRHFSIQEPELEEVFLHYYSSIGSEE